MPGPIGAAILERAFRPATLDRIVRAIELTAAGFLALVTAMTFISVIQRDLYGLATRLHASLGWEWVGDVAQVLFWLIIPDAYDFSALLLGALIFWGIAGASYRGEHITVDLIWSVSPPAVRRIMESFADLLTLGCLGVFAWMMGSKVLSTLQSNVQTFDLRLPVWVFYCLAWIGLIAAAVLFTIRTVRLLVSPDAREPVRQATAVE